MGADGCDKVLNSAWGTVFAGIPLSLVGVLAYGAVLLMALLPLVARAAGEQERPVPPHLVGAVHRLPRPWPSSAVCCWG